VSRDNSLIDEVKKRLEACITHESDNRQNAVDDLRFLKGEQWPEQMRRMRELEFRPCLTVNKLPTFLHQIQNDLRQNKPAIKVHPVDDNADIDTAEILQGMIRHIEYNSNADYAYDTAVSSAAAVGFGYFRLITDYCDPNTFDQEIRFRRIRNPLTVYFDSSSVEPDGSDAQYVILSEEVPKSEFKRQYPKASTDQSMLPQGTGDRSVMWIGDDRVRVVEYYRIESTTATLCQLTDGSTLWKDELVPGVIVMRERLSEKKVVRWYKLTGLEVLEDADIPCKWIPVFPVYGSEIDVDGRVTRAGMIRWAKDPQRMYNYWLTSATEEVSLRPKIPYIGAEGQFEGHEKEWSQANSRSFAYLEYKPVTIDGTLASAPARQPMSDIPSGAIQMAMLANDNIKATTGMFDASLGARGNETSGKAILARQREGDTANFHYADNLSRAIRHAGRCIVDMIPKVYDAPRIVRIMGEDDAVEAVQVNQPREDKAQIVLTDLTVGKYDVTVSVGPSYSTMRQEAADAMMQFSQSWPKLMDVAGDKVVRAMDWPGAEEIAERIKRVIPPEITQEEGEGPQEGLPPEVEQTLQQATEYIGMLQQQVQQLTAELQSKDADRQLKKYETDTNNLTRIAIEELKQETAQIDVRMRQIEQLIQPSVVVGIEDQA
jgi:hypothetical protein